jgi:hypothetical protein
MIDEQLWQQSAAIQTSERRFESFAASKLPKADDAKLNINE